MAYEGTLVDCPFPEVLQHIARQGDTGILTLQGEEEIIGVTFLDGEVVSVDAVNEAPEDGLGYVLERENLVSLDDFAGLVAENRAGGGRVTDLLLERSFITREELLGALRKQTLRLCAEACGWRTGHFRFYRGDQVSHEAGIEPLAVDDLLAQLAAPDEPEPRVAPTLDAPSEEAPAEPADDVPQVEILELEPSRVTHPELEAPPVEPPAVESLVVGYSEEGYADIEYPSIDYPVVEAPEPEEEPELPPATESKRTETDWWTSLASSKTPVLPGRLLSLGLVVSLFGLVLLAPGRFLLPLAGQDRIRTGIASGVQTSVYTKIDRAAKTHFLLRGDFPSELSGFAAMGLIDTDDFEAGGRPVVYTRAPLSYQLALDGERLNGKVRTETISGDFLLDPDFSPPEVLDRPPLVLLD